MKLTKSKLKEIIREELLNEYKDPEDEFGAVDNALDAMNDVDWKLMATVSSKGKTYVKQIQNMLMKIETLTVKLRDEL